MRKALVTTWLLAAPKAALACPVCFGQSDSPMAHAMNSGIVLMLVIVAGMLAAFAAFFVYLVRRAQRSPEVEIAGLQRQEGTAQC